MSNSMKGMSLITLEEFSPEQVQALLSQAIELKRKKQARIFPRALTNRNFCLIFQRTSCRTRTAFAIAAAAWGRRATGQRGHAGRSCAAPVRRRAP